MKKTQVLRRISCAGISLILGIGSILPSMNVLAEEVRTDLAKDLVAHYSFDDNNVNTTTRTVNNEASTGEVFNGILGSLANTNQTQVTVSTGIRGKALKFDGTESYFKIPNIINSAEDYTISMWINFDESSQTSGASINIIQQTNAQKEGRSVLYLKNKAFGSYVAGADIISQKVIPFDEWHHIVVSNSANSDGSSVFKIYQNGTEITNSSIASGLINKITDLQFGCHKNTNVGYSFKGSIDDVRYYNKSADEALVKALMGENEKSLKYYQLKSLVKEAEAKVAENAFEDTEPVIIELKKQIAEASKVTMESTQVEIMRVYEALNFALSAYNEKLLERPVELTIDTKRVTKTIPDFMFGTNHRYHMDGYGSWNTGTDKLYDEFEEISKEAKFGSVRYPGGIVSNLFQWKRSIGDKAKRTRTIHGNWNEPNIVPNFGIDEAAKYVIDDLQAEMIYVYGVGNGSAADAADLVEYLNCEVGENPNGGIDWAKVRSDNGHPKPYNVTEFEIGNELDEGRGYWLQNSPDQWSGSSLSVATMYAEGAVRNFVKEKVAELENWNTSNDKTKASYFSKGTKNQKRYMRYANDVTTQTDKSKAVIGDSVHVYVNDEEWRIVSDITTAGSEDKVVQINYENGEILFGDGIHGKIPTLNEEIRVSYSVYRDGLADYYDAMKAVDKDVKVYSGYSNANIAQAVANSEKASANGGKFDGMAVHPYSRSNGQISDNDDKFYEKILEKVETSVVTQVKSRKNELLKYWPDDSKKVVISEYGIFNHPGDVVQSQTHAVYIAANMMEFVDLDAAYTNKHCLIDFPGGDVLGPGKQALIQAIKQADGTYRFYGTPSIKVFSIFGEMSGTNILETEVVNNKKFYNNVDSVQTMSSKDEDGNVYMIAINTERDKETKVKIRIKEESLKGNSIQIMTLAGNDVYAINTLDNPNNVAIEQSVVECKGEILEYTLPAHSVVGFKLVDLDTKQIPVTSVTLDKSNESMEVGEKINLGITVLPENATNKVVTWSVANNEVASVSSEGVVTARAQGTTTVTATVDAITATCIITVRPEVDKKAQLKEAVAKAKNYDKNQYTEASFKKLESAIIQAEVIIEKSDATEKEIEDAVKELNYAISQLEIKPVIIKEGWKEEGNSLRYYEKNVVVSNKWVKEPNGTWRFAGKDGWMARKWLKDKGTWYYLDNKTGIMKTGWLKDGNDWYLLASSGKMQTGWKKDKGTWYYLNASGKMQTGWYKEKSTWYYLNSNGKMATGWVKVKGTWYYMSGSGAMQTGWKHIKGKWYYMRSNGAMATGWTFDGKKTYYLSPTTGAWNGQVK